MTGFFGKLPSRGDFLRSGLPAGFVSAWDQWVSGALAFSQERMGEAWLPAWLEAPIWRFLLPVGQCGPDGVLGLWMPSVDGVGRYFPLMLAATFTRAGPMHDDAWLDGAEASALAALEHGHDPAALQAALDALAEPSGAAAGTRAVWWTDGAPRVAATRLTADAMPAPEQFTRMLGGDR